MTAAHSGQSAPNFRLPKEGDVSVFEKDGVRYVVMPAADYEGLSETAHLLGSKENARELEDGMKWAEGAFGKGRLIEGPDESPMLDLDLFDSPNAPPRGKPIAKLLFAGGGEPAYPGVVMAGIKAAAVKAMGGTYFGHTFPLTDAAGETYSPTETVIKATKMTQGSFTASTRHHSVTPEKRALQGAAHSISGALRTSNKKNRNKKT